MSGKHPSHVTRFSFDASTYDEICTVCGATDQVPGGWGALAEPCPGPDKPEPPAKKEERMKAVNQQWTKAMNLNNVIRNNLPPDFPEIVILCGSTRFMDAYVAEQRRLTLEGKIVISVGLFGHQEGLDMGGSTKAMLDELHKRKIDLADRAHVIDPKVRRCPECKAWWKWNPPMGNVAGSWWWTCQCHDHYQPTQSRPFEMYPYIGSSTRSEIEYATANGKVVTYMEPLS